MAKQHWAPCPHQGKKDSWRTIWSVPDARDDLYIVHRKDQRACEDPLPPALAYAVLDRWAVNRGARAEFLDLHDALHIPHPGGFLPEDAVQHTVKEQLRQAFQRGELLLLRIPRVSGPGLKDVTGEASAGAAPPPQRETKKTWIEIRLVDMEDNPVGGKHYLIRTPSGELEEGNLDSSGRARVNNIDPGTCQISFPDLDREAWERVS